MAFVDLRDFLAHIDRLGMLRVVEGAHWDLEIGAISQMMQETDQNPILLFDKIPGFPTGFRVLANHQDNPRKQGIVLGVNPQLANLEIVREMKMKRRQANFIPPKIVPSGPILENCELEDKVNLFKFPTPRWRTLEGGRYIGTGTLVINRDPDEDWVNMGCYRQMIHDEKTVGFFVEPHHHGMIIAKKYWARGKACPVVACYGQDPELFQAAIASAPWGRSELDIAGGLKGHAVEVIVGELTGLPIPARAEIAIEGEVPPPETDSRIEGPYREWPGYYSQEPTPQPVIHVKALYHRNDPVMTGPPAMNRTIATGATTQAAIAVWEALDKTALPGILGVWAHANGLFIVISLKQQFIGHAKTVLLAATGTRGTNSIYRYYVTVDEDIDPSNLQDVLWAITTRCLPEEQIDIISGAISAKVDPLISPSKREVSDLTCGRVLINACKPYQWMEQFGKSMTFTAAFESKVREKWGHLLRGTKSGPASM